MHYHAIRLITINSLLGQVFLALGFLASPTWKGFAVFTLAAATVISVFFILGDHGEELRGLWQRLGFLFMYAWIWAVRLHLTPPMSVLLQQDRTSSAQVRKRWG